MANINLLPTEEKAAESFGFIQKRFLFGAIALIVITGAVTFGILGFFSIEASKRTDLNLRVEKSAAEIGSYKSIEELLVVIHDKVSDGQKILEGRADVDEVFSNLAELIPQGVYFSDIKFAGSKVSLSGKAKTSADAAGLASSLASSQAARVFSDVNMESLSSDDKGNYTFTLSMKLASSSGSEKTIGEN